MALNAWKDNNHSYKEVAASYAGRLDPMATGKLLILLGEECKKQAQYTKLDKEYEVEVLLDIGSDTGDALGITTYSGRDTRISKTLLLHVLKAQEGKHLRAYPAYSSKTVHGKPLFLYALEGTLNSIQIPVHKETLYRIRLLDTKRIEVKELRSYIDTFLSLTPTTDKPSKVLGADFRIKKVRESWDAIFSTVGEREFAVLRLRITAASGAYMRTLAERIGAAFGTKALALSISRTKIGRYVAGFWLEVR